MLYGLESTACPLVLVGVADTRMAEQACYSQAAEERSAGRVPAETKECRRCHETKGKADFYHSKMTADGLQSYCKVWLPYITFKFIACPRCLPHPHVVSLPRC